MPNRPNVEFYKRERERERRSLYWVRGCLRVSYKKRGAKILNLVRVMLLVQMGLFGQCSI